MNIKIGADELILWLQKNKKAAGIENRTLGRKIADLITKDLGGEFASSNEPVLWALSYDDKLPRTSQQYIIDVEKLPTLFKTLAIW